jgi:hypothetical protein
MESLFGWNVARGYTVDAYLQRFASSIGRHFRWQ